MYLSGQNKKGSLFKIANPLGSNLFDRLTLPASSDQALALSGVTVWA
jgi:hypothetical protein